MVEEVQNQALQLDLSGLMCPMPLLKTKLALNKMAIGEVVRVMATDPGSERDFQVFAEQSGHKLLKMDIQASAGVFTYWIQKN